jgi:hypothetical protein
MLRLTQKQKETIYKVITIGILLGIIVLENYMWVK